ncbi:MAG: tRNA dihydrouridine synthase [Desulforhopalus sp.]
MTANQPFIYLAPLRGLTDALFRNTFSRHFGGFDAALAPFINPQKKSLYKDKMIRDVLPRLNSELPLVPQLLHTDADDFTILAERLADLGYQHINWNLGCPAPMVVRKKRGSGLLPHPEEIVSLLERTVQRLGPELSIKTRLGYHSETEILRLLPLLNSVELKEVIIHPRLGKNLYKGPTNPDGFAACHCLSAHPLVYNGDIVNISTFQALADRFPTVNRWMIGRGALANPFLAEEIKGFPRQSPETRKERLYDFHGDLYSRYQDRLSGASHRLGRTKMLWGYLIASFPGQEKQLKRIRKCRTLPSYEESVEQLFHDEIA